MTGGGRLTAVALVVFLILVAGYAYVGLSLRQTYEAENALAEALAKSGPVWQAVRSQPVDEPGPLQRQIAEAQDRVVKQQALFPKQPEVISVLDNFLALAEKNQIQIIKVEAQAVAQQETKSGVYAVARYKVVAKGSWLNVSVFLRKLAEQGEFVAMGLENLAIATGSPDGDDLSFDLLIYARKG
jgi:hypothetical protein